MAGCQRLVRRHRNVIGLVLIASALAAMYLFGGHSQRLKTSRQNTDQRAVQNNHRPFILDSHHDPLKQPPPKSKGGQAILAEQAQQERKSHEVSDARHVPPGQHTEAEQPDAHWPRRHWMTGILASRTGLGNRLFHAASLYGLARASGSHTALFFPGDHLPCELFRYASILQIW